QVLPFISGPRVAGSGRQAATTSRGETCTPRTETGSVESRPSLFRVLSTSMNSLPSPYLKSTRCASSQRGIMVTSSCSTFTHSTSPMPSGNSKTVGSENGAVVYQPPLALSYSTGGFKHSSMVVQMEKDGAN